VRSGVNIVEIVLGTLEALKLVRNYRQKVEFGSGQILGRRRETWELGKIYVLQVPRVPCGLIQALPVSHAMPADTSTSTSHSNFASIFNAALEKYKRKAKQDLAKHPLLPRLQSCDSSEAILTVLREQAPEFNLSQNSDDALTKWVAPTVNVLYSFSATLGGAVGLVNISIFSYHIV
jgi:hypothetical protein